MKLFKTIAAYMIIALTLLFVPCAVRAADEPAAESAGSFAMAAIDSEGIVIEPCLVSYAEGETIKDALKNSGHEFYDLDADWIYTIDGHTDNYIRIYDGGAYNFDLPATEIKKALMFGPADAEITDDHLALVKLLAEHEQKEEAVRKYSPVKKAYAAAIEALPTANAAKAKTLCENLNAAYEKYESWIHQEKCKVTIKPMQNGTNISADITLTDSMGNVYRADESEYRVSLLEETYDFVIRKGYHEVSGSFSISKEEKTLELNPELPYGNWFGTITVKDTDKVAAPSETEGDVTTAQILDTTYSPYITITPGDDIPLTEEGIKNTKEYSIFSEHTSFELGNYYGDESVSSYKIPWNSSARRLVEASPAGLEETAIRLKVIHKDTDTGFTQRQYHELILQKIPTLKGLKVTAGRNELDLTPAFNVRTTEYSAETIVDTIEVCGLSYVYNSSDKKANCGEYKDGYSVEVNGTAQEENGSVSIPVSEDPITITVKGTNGLSSSCQLTVSKTTPKTIVVTKPEKEIEVSLKSSNGSIMLPDEETETNATFIVAPGTYNWITTMEEHYHASGAVSTGNAAVTVNGVKPVKEKLLSSIGLYSGIVNNAMVFQMAENKTFRWDDHEYRFLISDFATTVYVAAGFEEGVSVTREAYEMTTGEVKKAGALTNNTRSLLTRIIGQGIKNNSFVLTASKTQGEITYFQDYEIGTQRFATLESLAVFDKAGNQLQIFANGDETDTEFDSDITEYTLNVGETSEEISITAGFSNPTLEASSIGDCTIRFGASEYKKSESAKTVSETISLDPELSEEDINIEVFDENEENQSNTYHIRVVKIPPVFLSFAKNPADATVYVTDDISGARILPEEDGSFALLKGFSYTYTATAYGYVGAREKVRISNDQTVNVALKQAPVNPALDPTITAQWPYFRADENNNGVISYPVPTDPEDTVLYWAKRIGEGYSSNAAGCPIIADGYLYTYSGGKIVKLDLMTGEIKAEGEMYTGSAFAINSPTYAEGMIFVGLNNGGIQAFNAKTLESLWIYKDIFGCQPNCQITYKNGYIYTGYWNSETKAANLVCLSVTDEDPNLQREEKYPVWTYTGTGFYWAGAYASDNYVVIGSDDGKPGYTSGCGTLLSLDALTGEVIDKIDDQFTGDIRSSVCYDEASDRYYFVTKDGLFCSVKMNEDGTFQKNTVTKLQLYEMGGQKGMSTSTPVVHNGRAYVGVSGTGTFTQYTGHNITVIDLEGSHPVIAYKVATQGYPQTSGLLTTAYAGDDGSVYVYYFDNYTPGKLRVIKDKPGQTEPDPETLDTEEYELSGRDMTCDVAKAVFTPYGEHAQYAICSPIADEYGNIYFKNDSAHMMMLGAKITELKVTKKPKKTDYIIGELFDPTGMEVTATYANGVTRDVTEYVKFTDEPLTKDDTEIDLIFDLGSNMNMYQNHEGEAGVRYFVPQTLVSIKVTDAGFIPELISSLELSAEELEYTGEELRPEIASVNGSEELKEGEDYEVTWPETSIEPGTYTVTVTGIGKYRGTASAEYTIKQTKEPELITEIVISPTEFVFNGKEQHPLITLINGTDKLKEGVDYTVIWPEESVQPGTYTLTVTGIGDYTGSVSADYTIVETQEKIVLTSLELSQTEFYYNGETQRPQVRKINGSTALVEGRDYEVTWPAESVDAGTYTVTVIGIGDFTGTVSASYTIHEPKEPVELYHVRLTKASFTYNGKDQRPKISQVNESFDLEEDVDYVIDWPETSVNAGTYTVTLTGRGDYTGSVSAEYTIEPAELTKLELAPLSFTFNGKSQRPVVIAVNGNEAIMENVDYTLSWPKKTVDAGTYTVTAKGIGNYTGKASCTFTINKAANKLTAKPAKKTVKVKKKVQLKITNPSGGKLTFKITKGKKNIKVIKKGKKYYIQGLKKGKAAITVTSKATGNYKKATKKITITVKK